jgi:SecD/SecF fusion protein
MENRKKWHLFLILSVIAVTIYNILPTIFYYSKGLKKPISEEVGKKIATATAERVNKLEREAIEWVGSFCDLLKLKPVSVALEENAPQLLAVRFAKEEDAARFRRHLPTAGSLIPFAPAQLTLAEVGGEEASRLVMLKRNVPLHVDADLFVFAEQNSSLYRKTLLDRAAQIGRSLAGTSEPAALIDSLQKQGPDSVPIEWMAALASQVQSLQNVPKNSPLHRRLAASFTQGTTLDQERAVQILITGFERTRNELMKQASKTVSLDKKKEALADALKILKAEPALFHHGQTTQSAKEIEKMLDVSSNYAIGVLNPFFSSLSIDWENQKIKLTLHSDLKGKLSPGIEQLLIDEIAKLTRLTNESFHREADGYAASFHQKPETKSLLLLDLQATAKKLSDQTISLLKKRWHPTHPDFASEHFPIVDFTTYQTLSPEEQALCLVIYTPSLFDAPAQTLRNDSIYCFAKGIQRVAQNYEKFPESELAKSFQADLQALQKLLHQHGFNAYLSPSVSLLEDFRSDIIFEQRNSFDTLLAATREEFSIRGTKKQPFLELSTKEQRILAENKIDTSLHEDLLKWNDEYRAALVSLDSTLRYNVPKPTKNIFWSNLKLNIKKIFRGDEKKLSAGAWIYQAAKRSKSNCAMQIISQ